MPQFALPESAPAPAMPSMDDILATNAQTLVAGVLCGLIPLAVGLLRGRPDLGVKALLACVFAGLLKGYESAGPAALGLAALMLAVRPKRRSESVCEPEPLRDAFAPLLPLPAAAPF